ncbi:MAG: DUF3500 domain-containing protein [Pirellulales bacterium]|nr:DUF3500 domain-containing protein [Pirellulales bacterium]
MTRSLSFVALALLTVSLAAANENSTADVGTAMTDAAQKFLATLDDAARAKATMSFDDPRRVDWHNIPKKERKGLQVGDMTPAQREACHHLLRAALSDVGYDKAVKIMALENNLREGEKGLPGAPLRDPQRYFLTIFGQPESKGTWGWSFEGHHFSLNFVVRDGEVVSDTPSFWGANPATLHIVVPGGPEQGTRTLAQEEQLALDLVSELDKDQLAAALIDDKAPADYRAAGVPEVPQAPPVGLAAAKMTAAQREKLRDLLKTYSGNLAAPLAAARMADIEASDFGRVHFAWAGATQAGAPHYYRVQGPTFVLELVNYQSDPAGNPANHIHSVWRNMRGDFALPVK